MNLRVAIFARDTLVGEALGALLRARPEITNVTVARDTRGLAENLDGTEGTVILAVSGSDAPETVREIEIAHRDAAIVVVLSENRPRSRQIRGLVAAGAQGVIGVAASGDDVVDALRAARRGEPYIHPTLGAALASDDGLGPVDRLSPRERDVLRLIGLGMTSPEIADVLIVSPRTVETHRSRIGRKLEARSRADLVRHALESGLVTRQD